MGTSAGAGAVTTQGNTGQPVDRFVDTYGLTQAGVGVSGQFSLLGLERLLSGQPEQGDALVDWSVAGEKNIAGQAFLIIDVSARLQLECQRCLEPVEWQANVHSRLQLVAESALGASEHESDDADDAPERIAGSHRLDVQALVEDELILSLPYVPRHDVCPSIPAPQEEGPDADEKRPSPFSVLGELKK